MTQANDMVFRTAKGFLAAVNVGQIDRMCLSYMLSVMPNLSEEKRIDLLAETEGCDLEVAAQIILSTLDDNHLANIFCEAVEKMEREQGEPHFFVLMKYKDRKDLQYLTKDGELNPSDGDYFTQEELQRIWPTLILENLERIDILR